MANEKKNDQVDRSLDKIWIAGGIISLVIGDLMVWRGIVTYIPEGGLAYGGLFTAVGVALVIAGVFYTTYPSRRDKKRKAAEDEEA